MSAREITRGSLVALGLAFAAAFSGCTASAVSERRDAGAIDAGGFVLDGSASDASGRDAGSNVDSGVVAPPFGASESSGDARACGDFLNDTVGGADCDDDGCRGTRLCCVESTSETCCAAPASVATSLDLTSPSLGCAAGSPAASCATGVVGFGAAASIFVRDVDDASLCADDEGAMAPQGGARSDAGLLFARTDDTGAAAVAIEAHVGVGGSAASSIDAIAVGLTAQTDLDDGAARVRPIAAIVVSATDQSIRVVAGDIARDPLPLTPIFAGGGCHELEVRIETSPRGTFDAFYRLPGGELRTWTELARDVPFQTSPSAHLVVYGRTTNPGIDGVHAWVRSVGIESHLCDVLAPTRSAETVLEGSVAGDVYSLSRVDGFAAYEVDGTIRVAGVDGRGHVDSTSSSVLIDPAIEQQPFYAAGAFDPELARVGTNVRLYFTGLAEDGVRSIGYVDYSSDVSTRVTGSVPRQLFAPSAAHVSNADGASYLEAVDAGTPPRSHRVLVFRAEVEDPIGSHSEIRALELVGTTAVLGSSAEEVDFSSDAASGVGFYSRESPLMASETLYRSVGEAAFDRDEIAQPEVVLYHGVFRILFAGRRGGRWSIGMLRSPDFQHFELASREPVLTASGEGFDSVSVFDPDVFVEDDQLSLYYSGANGTETRPGLATQAIPTL